ncbi:MAG: family 43 glycosylhydrolase [Planctomycetota bacterium]
MKSSVMFSRTMVILCLLCVSGVSLGEVTEVSVDDYEPRVFTSSKGDTIQYRLFIPRGYDTDKKYPLVLFHHGAGGSGDDNRRQFEGPLPREWAGPERQVENPCFIVAPQIPRDRSRERENRFPRTEVMRNHIQTIHEILDSLEEEFSIDRSREYVTGLSMGGECTWVSIIERPDRFAAAVPICAGDKFIGMEPKEMGRKFTQLPIWIFHGDADDVISVDVSRRLVKALKDAGGNPKYTEYPGVDHGSWELAYREPELIEWIFAQSSKPTKKSASVSGKNVNVINPSFESAATGWSDIITGNSEFYSPVDGLSYATREGGAGYTNQETDHTITASETYTLKVWARSINERKNDAETIAEVRFHHGTETIASVKKKVNPVTLSGAPEEISNDDGGNIWIDQGYRHEFADKHFYQKLSDDPLTDEWEVSNDEENYLRGMAVGPIITPEGLKAAYYCRYRDRDDRWSSIHFITAVSGGSPAYKWSEPKTVLSHVGDEDPWVIDPHLFYDDDTGKLWMTWGGGTLYVCEMDPTDGMLLEHPEDKEFDSHPEYHTAVATWPEGRDGWNGDEWSYAWMEGGSIYKHNGYWYFFACYGHLGRNYTIRMGRGTSPAGPFYDKNGIDLMKFDPDRNKYGCTLILGAEGSQENPGHPHVWQENGRFYMGLDYTKDRRDVFGIRELHWVHDWPVVAYTPIEITFKSDDHPDAMGKKLGISFRNAGDPNSTAAFDHASLTYTCEAN